MREAARVEQERTRAFTARLVAASTLAERMAAVPVTNALERAKLAAGFSAAGVVKAAGGPVVPVPGALLKTMKGQSVNALSPRARRLIQEQVESTSAAVSPPLRTAPMREVTGLLRQMADAQHAERGEAVDQLREIVAVSRASEARAVAAETRAAAAEARELEAEKERRAERKWSRRREVIMLALTVASLIVTVTH